jgi:hypothetical protein
LHLATKPRGHRSFISFFASDGEDREYGAILVQVKNCLHSSNVKDVGRKLFVSSVFKHWTKEEHNLPIFALLLASIILGSDPSVYQVEYTPVRVTPAIRM